MVSLRTLKRGWSKLRRKGRNYYAQMDYIKYVKTLPLDDRAILLEASHGAHCNGNMFYMLRELVKPEYGDYRLYLGMRASKVDSTREFLEAHGICGVNIVAVYSDDYYRVCATAKYLVNDTTFLPFFVKRDGQVYLNTWHGTPLKHMGKAYEHAANSLGNVQRNFCITDYLLAPNDVTETSLRDDYMLANLAKTRMVIDGYPRNEAFFDDDSRDRVREEMEFGDDLNVIAYMPTWREYRGFASTQAEAYLIYYLSEIDKRLDDRQVMYVNLHPLSRRKINLDCFEHIHPFPERYETYEFLNACDRLVTDYSSVMFDYMLTGRPIILFDYDVEQYLEQRGCYEDPRGLGYIQAPTLASLLEAFHDERCDYGDARKRFAPYDSPMVSKELCSLLLGDGNAIPAERIHEMPDNGKENVLIYSGDLAKNGLTSSLRSLLRSADKEHYNYILTLKQRLPQDGIDTLAQMSGEQVDYTITQGKMNLTVWQKMVHYLYSIRLLPFFFYHAAMGDAYKQELLRLYGGMRIDRVIHFTGYVYKKIELFEAFDGPRTIYVHNNMIEEIRRRGNQRRAVLRHAYRHYDHVALVTEDMREPTKCIAGRDDNFVVAPNAFDHRAVCEKASLELTFDDFTHSNRGFDDIRTILDGDVKKIISIGRFSPEKGHRRLIEAFGNELAEHPDAVLIIVGGRSFGRGPDSFAGLGEYVETLDYADHVVLIENMSNPYPLLRRCDALILPSYHEGFGLVLLEADVLGLPVVATDIPGPQRFLAEHGGKLVPNTDEGVREGLEFLLSGKGHTLDVDYEEYNRKAVEAFESMLES
ncbi:CDP-glycerol glycerophosphotransferase family protein [Bifidobacterium sp. 82T24]|uniref:glycosyltransferase n=1 Tax=Bifidobacterium pluvialisilvae TaxID=2834436 RepID=UPI001C594C72|nr:glycosyltransferase [Bifidobacterium pluvialisilvae]MBW3088450.1 CDP-glycerol glycerophosphotransferase family protein [Bifidobacterium pluvialisilvae]